MNVVMHELPPDFATGVRIVGPVRDSQFRGRAIGAEQVPAISDPRQAFFTVVGRMTRPCGIGKMLYDGSFRDQRHIIQADRDDMLLLILHVFEVAAHHAKGIEFSGLQVGD